jgi:hypothetical protein
MAEHEVIKHAKRAFKVSRDPKKHWKEKVGEIVLDIFIIVFAISLSLYLHGRAEKKGERHLEEEFLQGLKVDLQKDLKELAADSISYEQVRNGFFYFYRAGTGRASFVVDSAHFHENTLYRTTDLQANDSRFQGLKASGKLYVVEDKELLNDILDLYQEKIPHLIMQTNGFSNFKRERLSPYMDTHLIRYPDGTNNMKELISAPVFRNYMSRYGYVPSIIEPYQQVMEQCRLIIRKIEKQYE